MEEVRLHEPGAVDALLEGTATRFPGYEAGCVTPTGTVLPAGVTGDGPFSGDLVPDRGAAAAARGLPAEEVLRELERLWPDPT